MKKLHLPLESPEQIKKWLKFVFKNFIISFAPVSKKVVLRSAAKK
jgi:hypothetical protein